MSAKSAGADDAKPRETKEKVPAVVLVHGGGGTAFADWVKMWTACGYAAIAVDLEGQIPTRDATGKAWIRTATLPRPGGMVTGWVNLIDDRGLAVSSRLLPPAAE